MARWLFAADRSEPRIRPVALRCLFRRRRLTTKTHGFRQCRSFRCIIGSDHRIVGRELPLRHVFLMRHVHEKRGPSQPSLSAQPARQRSRRSSRVWTPFRLPIAAALLKPRQPIEGPPPHRTKMGARARSGRGDSAGARRSRRRRAFRQKRASPSLRRDRPEAVRRAVWPVSRSSERRHEDWC